MNSVLLPFRILGILMIMIGTVSVGAIIAAPFANYLQIPRVLIEWGLNASKLANSAVLWVLFFFIFGTGYILLLFSTEKERRPEISMVASGILLIIGSIIGICLFLDQTGLIQAEDTTALWILLFINYLIGLYGVRKNITKVDQLAKRDQERLKQEPVEEEDPPAESNPEPQQQQ